MTPPRTGGFCGGPTKPPKMLEPPKTPNPVYYPISGNLAQTRIPLSTKISMPSETCTKFTTFLAHNPQYQIQKTFAQCVTVVKSLFERKKNSLPTPLDWKERVLRLLPSSVSSYAHHSWQTTFGSSSVSDTSHSCASK